ncbi:MAG: hypothetical protein D6689_19205 [Deltaproteobacteria bacterium]|nr:MAG: hypothetical protein D6689_19205 [Deltaproteobacteria bacterium]
MTGPARPLDGDSGHAVAWLAAGLTRPQLAAMARRVGLAADGTAGAIAGALVRRFELDLAGFLNVARRDELAAMARAAGLSDAGSVGDLRARLWRAGAEREAGGTAWMGTPVQPVPVLLGRRLVVLVRGDGVAPPSPRWPRPVPPVREPSPPATEPDTIDELLDAARALVGVRLGAARRDKGAFGAAIAAALGVAERGAPEPDWRGEVEIKSVPVVRDRAGWWRVKEDPAVAVRGRVRPLAKLRKVLWVARVADDAASPVLSWYYQEADARVVALLRRDLHTRPKGGAGATTRGWYVRKRFFADSGFLQSLNG